jgi:hypothetical protein
MARPARVLAWHCNWCGVWVTPKKFCLLTGTCDTCVRELSDGAGW